MILCTNDDVVNWNMDEFDEETNEAHNTESDGCGNSYLLVFLSIWFGASFDQAK